MNFLVIVPTNTPNSNYIQINTIVDKKNNIKLEDNKEIGYDNNSLILDNNFNILQWKVDNTTQNIDIALK